MARLGLSKLFIPLFIMVNMMWRMFDPSRLSFRVTSCKRSVAPKSSRRDPILQLEWVQIADLAQGVGRHAVRHVRRRRHANAEVGFFGRPAWLCSGLAAPRGS